MSTEYATCMCSKQQYLDTRCCFYRLTAAVLQASDTPAHTHTHTHAHINTQRHLSGRARERAVTNPALYAHIGFDIKQASQYRIYLFLLSISAYPGPLCITRPV